jgi:hypothetical protein
MMAGPIRRAAAMLGLLALVPTALMLATGGIDLPTAAIRAAATLAAVVVVAKIVSAGLRWVAGMAGSMAAAASLSDPLEVEGQRANAMSAASRTAGSNADSD